MFQSSNSYFEKKRLAKPSYPPSIPSKRLPRSQMNFRDFSKAQAKSMGPRFYDSWKEFKRNELQRLVEQAKELRNQCV